jgi:hypothetical protein
MMRFATRAILFGLAIPIAFAMACQSSPAAVTSRLYRLAVAGTVVSSASNAPVPGASVAVTYSQPADPGDSSPVIVTTDPSGRFSALLLFYPYAATVSVAVRVTPPAGTSLGAKSQTMTGQLFKPESQAPDTARFTVALDHN